MSDLKGSNTKKNSRLFKFFLVISILEGLTSILATLLISPDPKNAFIFGFSLRRLVILVFSLLILGGLVFFLVRSEKVRAWISNRINSDQSLYVVTGIGIFAALFLWITIWFPTYRFGKWEAGFIRIKPLLLWFQLIGLQFAVLIKATLHEINFKKLITTIKGNIKFILIVLGVVTFGVTAFILMKALAPQVVGKQAPGAPLAPLQIFSMWIVFLGVYYFNRDKPESFLRKNGWIIASMILIWISAFILWNSAPLHCQDDRPGPFPPNYQCYPNINDAVSSIGSHYITLGQGIYNHWLTDKPLYMVFVALGQWIFGPNIDNYLNFQIAVIAIIPALLFLFGKRFAGYSGGIFLAGISILKGYNDIVLYTQVGGGGVKFENSEYLTSLFLILLCFSVFEWLRKPSHHIWAIVSGGVLGLSTLIRMNPIFIAPVILLVYGISNRKNLRSLLVGILVFIVTFGFVFAPWLLTAQDSQGNSFYLSKIQNIITERYSVPNISNTTDKTQISPSTNPTIQTETPGSLGENQAGSVSSLQDVSTMGFWGIAYHFFDNEFLSLGILPINFSFVRIVDQVKQPIWDFKPEEPIWKVDLSIENILALIFTLTLIILGIFTAVNKFGIAGLSALVIQIGYHIGNAFAKTSGGRYLEPVNWVTLLYFGIGIYAATLFLFDIFTVGKDHTKPIRSRQNKDIDNTRIPNPKRRVFGIIGGMGIFLVLGLIIPLLNNLPSRLPAEVNPNAIQVANNQLIGRGTITTKQWQDFLTDPGHLIIQGTAYHARYYRDGDLWPGNQALEMMVLGKDHVFASYLFDVEPVEKFSDGSGVILVGCQMGQDYPWAANRIIMQSFAVIQMDNEKSVYIDPKANWKCTKP